MAVAVVRRGDRVLIARRPDGVHQGGLLEFPGGKVEPDETVQQALVRELAEETGLAIEPGSLRPVIGIRHDYGDKRVFLDVWQTDSARGEPEGREGQPVAWRALSELRDAEFPAANRAIIRALQLPDVYAITGPFSSHTEALGRLRRGLAGSRPRLVLLRAPWLTPPAYEALAGEALALCRQYGAELMLHGPLAAGAGTDHAGWHLTWAQASVLRDRPLPAGRWLAVSCHDLEQIEHARALGADFITLAPVHPTTSHPGAASLGWQAFRQLAAAAAVPVYALGGMGPADLDTAIASGGQGIAGIGCWWGD